MPATAATDCAGARWGRRRVLIEVAVTLVVGVITIVGTALAAGHQDRGDLTALGIALLLVAVLALPFRYRHPPAILGVALVATLAYWSLGYPKGPIFLPLLIALGEAVITGHRRAAITSLIVGFFGFLWLGYLIGREDAPDWGQVIALAAWLISLLSVTELIRSRRDRAPAADHRRAPADRARAARRGRAQHVADQHPGRRRAAPHERRSRAGA